MSWKWCCIVVQQWWWWWWWWLWTNMIWLLIIMMIWWCHSEYFFVLFLTRHLRWLNEPKKKWKKYKFFFVETNRKNNQSPKFSTKIWWSLACILIKTKKKWRMILSLQMCWSFIYGRMWTTTNFECEKKAVVEIRKKRL